MARGRDRIIAIVMLMPSIILLAIFVYGFIGSTAYTSMTNETALSRLSQKSPDFVGLENYEKLFTGSLPVAKRFRIDMSNTVFFTIMFIIVCLSVGLLLAILLDQKIRGEAIFRTIFLFPMALSFVVTGVVWKWLFNPNSGLNTLPTLVGLPALPKEVNWFLSESKLVQFNWQNIYIYLVVLVLGIILLIALINDYRNPSQVSAFFVALSIFGLVAVMLDGGKSLVTKPSETQGFNVALIAVVIAAGWQMSGYTMAMYLAGLRGIPEELREAARVDGATELGVYRHVVFPMLAPITLSAIIILGHISLKIFDLVYVMGGGDLLFIDMPGLNMFFETFRGNNFGNGAAIAIVILILVTLVIVPYLWSNARSEANQ